MSKRPPEIELLAPAGNWQCAKAAVENGADAIYFGLDAGFNARARAANFHLDDLPDLMKMLHGQGVRGYVTLNTLVFTDELPKLEENVRALAAAGVDAVLVQDLGVAKLIGAICPEMEIHASTQMTLTNAQAIEIVKELNVSRAVLARELSIREIDKITDATQLPVESFVHGALCVAYSGQCLTSESLGGRSANRGQCAQACRLPYEIYRDGEKVDLGTQQYLLSPQDLAAHDYITEMIDAGVCSLKIEGRLKTPEYVANVCGHYRKAIDEALQGRSRKLTAEQSRELELSFSRGFSPGWLEGCDHKRLVPGQSSAKRGVEIGRIKEVRGDALRVELSGPLSVGDGVVVEGDRAAEQEFGGRVYELRSVQQESRQRQSSQKHLDGGLADLYFQRGALPHFISEIGHIAAGVRLYKTDDPQLTKRLRRTFQGEDPVKRIPVDVSIRVAVGEPIRVVAKSTRSAQISFEHSFTPEIARKHAIDSGRIAEQLDRLGGTTLRLGKIEADIVGEPMLPHSILGEIRKQLVTAILNATSPEALLCSSESETPRLLNQIRGSDASEGSESAVEPELRVLCRSLPQVKQALELGCKTLIAELHDVREYRQACELTEEAQASVELATLRIHKPGEDGLFKALHRHYRNSRGRSAGQSGCSGWLVRNLAAMGYARENDIPFAADFSLNVTNPITASILKQWGASRLSPSYDLNRDQLIELVQHTPPKWLEVVIHQHIPMFHMEHCVFCSVLSPGKNKSDCGRPCDRHDVKLRDRVGADHVLHADIGCRNTLYNGSAQSGAEAVAPLVQRGVRQFRVELLRDTPIEVTRQLLSLYRSLLKGEVDGATVWKELNADNRIGVTRGTLEQPRNPLAII